MTTSRLHAALARDGWGASSGIGRLERHATVGVLPAPCRTTHGTAPNDRLPVMAVTHLGPLTEGPCSPASSASSLAKAMFAASRRGAGRVAHHPGTC